MAFYSLCHFALLDSLTVSLAFPLRHRVIFSFEEYTYPTCTVFIHNTIRSVYYLKQGLLSFYVRACV